MQIWIFHLLIRWLLKLILWKTGCERAATATSKVFLASFTITRHFVIKLLMLQNLVLVKSTSNYIHQLACNCILLFLIPKTLLGIFDKLIFPGFGSWDGDKNASLQKRLNGLKYLYVLKFRLTWNTEDDLQRPEQAQNERTQAEKGFKHYPATFWFLGTSECRSELLKLFFSASEKLVPKLL